MIENHIDCHDKINYRKNERITGNKSSHRETYRTIIRNPHTNNTQIIRTKTHDNRTQFIRTVDETSSSNPQETYRNPI